MQPDKVCVQFVWPQFWVSPVAPENPKDFKLFRSVLTSVPDTHPELTCNAAAHDWDVFVLPAQGEPVVMEAANAVVDVLITKKAIARVIVSFFMIVTSL